MGRCHRVPQSLSWYPSSLPTPPPPQEQLLAWNSFYWVFHLLLQTEGGRTLSWVFGAEIRSSFVLFVCVCGGGFIDWMCSLGAGSFLSCEHLVLSFSPDNDWSANPWNIGWCLYLARVSCTFSQSHWLLLLSLSHRSSVPQKKAHYLICVAFLLGPWADGYQEDHARGKRLTEGSWL